MTCLNEARSGILAGVVGAARSCYLTGRDYTLSREQFDKPLAGFQLTKRKLADMVVAVNRASLLALQISRLKDAGRLHHNPVSVGKLANPEASDLEELDAVCRAVLVAYVTTAAGPDPLDGFNATLAGR